MVDQVVAKKAELVRAAVGDLDQWQTSLRSLANHLEDLSAQAVRVATRDVRPGPRER